MNDGRPAGGGEVVDRREWLGAAAAAGAMAVGGAGLLYTGSRARPEPAERPPSARFVARICEIVLPSDETPGAANAGVPRWLPFAFSRGMFGGTASTLGLLEAVLDEKAGGEFLRAARDRQVRIVAALDADTFSRRAPPPAQTSAAHSENSEPGVEPAPAEPLGNRLWRIVKQGIVSAYFTSEIGASRTLRYQLAAGADYRADVPLGSVPYLSNLWIENVF